MQVYTANKEITEIAEGLVHSLCSGSPPRMVDIDAIATKLGLTVVYENFAECESLTERQLACPYCHYPLDGVLSDTTGHLREKCQKCKANMVLSLAYFRRQRGYGVRKRYMFSRYDSSHN